MTPEEDKEQALWRQQKHREFKAELMQNEVMLRYAEQTYPDGREQFISDYAQAKVNWLEYGPRMKEWLEKEDLEWVNDAENRLNEIQQKKLFDLQCLWRAEKIQIDTVQLTVDFKEWEKNILNCPFVPPITEEEVDMYIQYLRSSNFERQLGWFEAWQDYEDIKDAYNSEEDAERNFPEWYDFHNGRTGLSVYLLLPDIRGEKERFYFDLWFKETQREQKRAQKQAPVAVQPQPAQPPDTRPWINYWNEGWITWFVKTFEDKETQQMFERYGGEKPFEDYDESLEEDLKLLGRADRIIPIDGWYDWKEAIHKTADRYRTEKIIEALPTAFDRYKMNLELNIPFEKEENILSERTWYYNAILGGRVLNGEPQDFDF